MIQVYGQFDPDIQTILSRYTDISIQAFRKFDIGVTIV